MAVNSQKILVDCFGKKCEKMRTFILAQIFNYCILGEFGGRGVVWGWGGSYYDLECITKPPLDWPGWNTAFYCETHQHRSHNKPQITQKIVSRRKSAIMTQDRTNFMQKSLKIQKKHDFTPGQFCNTQKIFWHLLENVCFVNIQINTAQKNPRLYHVNFVTVK